jgi:hypothetical protein
MKRLTSSIVLLGLCAVPALAFSATYENVPVVDVNCSKRVAADPDSHTRDCALKCASSGFGIVTSDQKFLKFDPAGNAKVEEALKASEKKDHLRANVEGDVHGNTLKVTSIKLL